MVRHMLGFFYLLVLLLLHNRGAHCVFVRDNTPFENNGPPDGVTYCVDLTMEDSVCSTDPIGVYKHLYSEITLDDIHQGVPQRIDGSEEEKRSIKEILKLMNVYWYEEVLSNIEYDEARASWYVTRNRIPLIPAHWSNPAIFFLSDLQ
jgi:hypothetical protein